jgi:hypothetical protein
LSSNLNNNYIVINSKIEENRQNLENRLNGLSNDKIRECRICFQEIEGSSQCQGNRSSCSGWTKSESGKWTISFRDDTHTRDGGCQYQGLLNADRLKII